MKHSASLLNIQRMLLDIFTNNRILTKDDSICNNGCILKNFLPVLAKNNFPILEKNFEAI